jgi:plasmid stabilization system protein ParE
MTCRIVLPAEAEDQLRAAHEWWRENRPASPDLFVGEFEEAVRLLAEMPTIGPRFRRATIPGVRRLLLRKSRYWIYYVHDDARSVVYVLSVWGTRRGMDPPLERAP